MTTGEIIKDLLIQKGCKQADLARFLGVSSNTVNRWLPTNNRQGSEPSPENIRKIAEFFEVSTDIVTGSYGKYGSPEHMDYLKSKYEKNSAFIHLLETFGYEIVDDSFDPESDTINPPKEFRVKWNSEERFIKSVDFDLLLKKIEKHIKIEIEEYY